MNAQQKPSSDAEAQVLSFPEQSGCSREELLEIIARLREERTELARQNYAFGTFIRNLGQMNFSTDDNSRYYASIAAGRPVCDQEARAHWFNNGGPEQFSMEFPTPESVMRHFLMSHTARKNLKRFNLA